MTQVEAAEAEVFIRYIADEKAYEAKIGTENAPTMRFGTDKVEQILSVMTVDMAKVFSLLVTEARKEPEGRWVSASTKPAQKGQVVVG